MAIEFHCPYCSAAIRVPDTAAGRRGSCPQCSRKLIVPEIGPPPPSAAAEPPAPATPPTPAAPPVPEPTVPQTFVPEAPSVVPSPPGGEESSPPFVPAPATPSVARQLRRRSRGKTSQRIMSILIPVVCFVLLFGVITLFMYFRTPDLKGRLVGAVAEDMITPPVSVSLASFALTDEELTKASLAFEGSPETFASPQMSCTMALTDDQLEISVRSGDDYVWYAVNPHADPALALWIPKNRAALNKQRLKDQSEAGAQLCRDKILREGGQRVQFDAMRYRNQVGLSSHVKGFGYAVEAVAGNRLSPCVHEDSNGTIYFLLPRGTATFTLRGREFAGKKLFPGEYTATVSAAELLQAEPTEEESSDDAPEDESMPSEEMNEPADDDSMASDRRRPPLASATA